MILPQPLQIHFEMLTKWRSAMDLVGPGPLEPHFEDSIQAVSNLPMCQSWVDLGSGAGFPGIALAALFPKSQITLVESRQKRAVFLRRVISKAQLTNINVHQGRTEELFHHSFNGTISRAYKPPFEYLKDAQKLLSQNGIAVCLLGSEGVFQAPLGWRVVKDNIYPVGAEFRKKVVLKLTNSL